MFDDNYNAPESALRECRPDPEEMLQSARKRIEACEKAEKLLIELSELPISISFGDKHGAHLHILGSIRDQYFKAKKNEEDWLKEIDKD